MDVIGIIVGLIVLLIFFALAWDISNIAKRSKKQVQQNEEIIKLLKEQQWKNIENLSDEEKARLYDLKNK